MLSFFRCFIASGLICGVTLTFVACGGGNGIAPNGNVVPPQSSQSTAVHPVTQTATTHSQAVTAASPAPNPCTKAPVKSLAVSTNSIAMSPSTSTSFQACTQYAGAYTITASPSNETILTFPKTVNPVYQPSTIEVATINVTAGATAGTVGLKVRDKKGNTQTVTVTISVGPLSLTCPALGNAGGTSVSCTYTNPGYGGGYNAVGTSTTSCTASAASGGSFTVGDTAAEGCIVTLTPSSGSQTAQTATIQFVGPLSLSCPGPGAVNGAGITCTITNANYPGGDTYTISNAGGSCAAGSLSGSTFTVTDGTAETTCKIQVAANSGSEASTSQTMTFIGPLTLTSCTPLPAPVGASGTTCTYNDPGYSGNYGFSKTGNCTVSAATGSTITFTDGSAEECDATLTESSSPGQTATQKIQFVGPLTFGCDSAAASASSPGANCNYSYAGFTGTLATSVDTSCTPSSSAPTPVTGGSFTVSDSTNETCTVTLTPSSGPFSAQSQQITFSTASSVGPLSLNCAATGTTNIGVNCTISNPNYTESYTDSTSSTTCTLSSESNSGLTVSDSAAETCSVTVTPAADSGESAVSKNITFSSSRGGGGGGGCSGTRKPHTIHVKKNGKDIGFVVQC